MADKSGAYRVLVGRHEGKRPLGRCGRRRDYNITVDFQESNGVINWIDLAWDRYR
jgi:hypothetical protein